MTSGDLLKPPKPTRAWVAAGSRPLPVDYSGLRVRRRALATWVGQAGYRPIVLLVAAIFLACAALLPIPGSLVDLVEQVNPPGYSVMEANTETIVDSVNYRQDPAAFEAQQQGGAPAGAAGPLGSGEEVARLAMIMLGILFVAGLLWGTEALPIGGTVILVAVLMFVFEILPPQEIPKAFVNESAFSF